MFDSSWREYLKRMATAAGRRTRRGRQRPPVRLQLEPLEPRRLMTINATGQASVSFIEGNQNQVLLGTFTDSTPSPVNAYTATIHWNGSTSTGSVSLLGSTFFVTGMHTYADEVSTQPITVNIVENGDDNDAAAFTTTAVVADATLHASVANFSPGENQSFSGTVATFTDNNPLATTADFTVTITWGDGTTSAGALTGSNGQFAVSGSHPFTNEGAVPFAVSIQDVGGQSTGASTTVNVLDTDLVASAAGVTLTYTEGKADVATLVSFSDPGTDPATAFSALINWGDGSTQAGTILGSNGSYSVRNTHTYVDEGSFTVSVQVFENGVNPAPVTTVLDQATAAEADTLTATVSGLVPTENQVFSGTVATFTDSYAGNTAGDFTATIAWGDGATGIGTIGGSNGSFAVTGSHQYADEGPYTVSVALVDVNDTPGNQATASVTATGLATVAEGDVLSSMAAVTIQATEGTTFSGTVARFSDTNTANTANDFTAVINWGDTTTSLGTVSGSGGQFTVAGSHKYTEDGSYNVSTVATDDAPGSVAFLLLNPALVAENDLAVQVQSANLTGPETSSGTTFFTTVALFQDASENNPANFSAVIQWGDGTQSTATPANFFGNSGSFGISIPHAYTDEGTYLVTVTVGENGVSNSSVTAVGTATVTESDALAAVGSAAPINTTEGNSFSGTLATFHNTGYPGNSASDFTAFVLWGDGTVSTAAVSAAATAGFYAVNGSHSYADELNAAAYTVLILEHDLGTDPQATAQASAVGTVTVTEGDALTLTVGGSIPESGAVVPVTVATFTDSFAGNTAGDFSAVITWNDGSTSVGMVSGSNGQFTVTGSHQYAEEGNYTVGVTLTDDLPGSASTSATGTVVVTEAAHLTAQGTPVAATEGTTFNGTVATFSDPGSLDPAGAFTALIQWGDGQTSAGTIGGSNGTYNVQGSHKYAEDGSSTVTVTIAETGTANSTATATTTATIAEGDLTAAGVPTITPAVGTSFSGTVATFSDPGSPDPATSFSAIVNWGDGQTSAGTVVGAGGSFNVQGTHTYANPGNFPVTVSIAENGIVNGLATASSMASVAHMLVDVTNSFTIGRGGQLSPTFNPNSSTVWSQAVVLTNSSGMTLTGPFELVLQNRVNGIVTNATGTTPGGDPYYFIALANLAPGGSVTVVLKFTKPNNVNATFDFTPKVYEVI